MIKTGVLHSHKPKQSSGMNSNKSICFSAFGSTYSDSIQSVFNVFRYFKYNAWDKKNFKENSVCSDVLSERTARARERSQMRGEMVWVNTSSLPLTAQEEI